MATTTATTGSTPRTEAPAAVQAELDSPRAREAFGTIGTYTVLFGVTSAAVLAAVAAAALTGHSTSPFMWVRAVLLAAAAPLLRRYAAKAAAGSYPVFDRIRTLSATVPAAIIGVDAIPGLCPVWYAAVQGLSVLPLAGIAVLTRAAALKAAFPRRPRRT
jgi:hypothetical protein